MEIRAKLLRTAFLLLLTSLVLSCGRKAPNNSENAERAGAAAAPSNSANPPQSEVHTASGTTAIRTIKVLQYNVKQGKTGQTCCWRDPSIRAKEQAVIVEDMANQGVELASLIESDNLTGGGVYNCSSLADLLGKSAGSLLGSLDSQCTLCAAKAGFKEALHLLWNTKKWKTIKGYGSANTCFGNTTTFEGRAFAAVLLQNVQDPSSEVVFIGVHPGHGNQDFGNGADPIWAAYNDLAGASTNSPKLIMSGDFNLTCSAAARQITQSSKGAVSIDTSNQCANPPLSCCCDSSFQYEYDHVFTNLPSAKVSTAISSSYGGPFTPPEAPNPPCPNYKSEEHKPVVGTITY